jgi:triacylglycerol lipase
VSTRHLVDPELLELLDTLPSFELSHDVLPAMRSRVFPADEDPNDLAKVDTEIRTIPGPKGAPDVSIAVIKPKKADGLVGAIVHMHGGGYVMGSVEQFMPGIRMLAARLGCVIVSVDYRVAPETVFPGAIEDCYAALAWTFQNAKALGIDDKRIGVSGESAGGGLAAALALLARDRGEYKLAFQNLIYPMVDDRTGATTEPHAYTGEFVWSPSSNVFGWTAILGKPAGSDDVSHYAAAARAADLSNLPPTFIACGSIDLFIEENLEYARRLMRAGVPVELHVYPGAFHGFQRAVTARVAQDAARDRFQALKRAVG